MPAKTFFAEENRVVAKRISSSLGKTIRAMADGSLDSQRGARICNGLGIMRACFETQKLERIEERLTALEDPLRASPAPQERRAMLQ
jgi:hypothetical protein